MIWPENEEFKEHPLLYKVKYAMSLMLACRNSHKPFDEAILKIFKYHIAIHFYELSVLSYLWLNFTFLHNKNTKFSCKQTIISFWFFLYTLRNKYTIFKYSKTSIQTNSGQWLPIKAESPLCNKASFPNMYVKKLTNYVNLFSTYVDTFV